MAKRARQTQSVQEAQRVQEGLLVPHLVYENVKAAVEWLTTRFNFVEMEAYRKVGPDGMVYHAEMLTGKQGSRFLLGPPGGNIAETPLRTGRDSMAMHVYVNNIDEHFENSRKAGVQVVAPCDWTLAIDQPEMQFYGDLVYWALDCDRHYWVFHQRVHDIAPQDWKWDRPLKPIPRAPLPYLRDTSVLGTASDYSAV